MAAAPTNHFLAGHAADMRPRAERHLEERARTACASTSTDLQMYHHNNHHQQQQQPTTTMDSGDFASQQQQQPPLKKKRGPKAGKKAALAMAARQAALAAATATAPPTSWMQSGGGEPPMMMMMEAGSRSTGSDPYAFHGDTASCYGSADAQQVSLAPRSDQVRSLRERMMRARRVEAR